MNPPETLINKETVKLFLQSIRRFITSSYGPQAKKKFAGLILLLVGINAMNVLNNYVGRDFMTAIENRNQAGFAWLALLYLGVFAASTLVTVLAKVWEDRLGLLWREFLTKRAIHFYLDRGTYYRVETDKDLENPDQRIAEDVRAFTVTTLSFVVILFNSGLTILAFSGVVFSISPLLFAVAVVYAACGSFVAFKLGRPLVSLNYAQLDKDANLRSTLLHVRENAEPLLLGHREGRLKKRLLFRFDEVAANIRRVILVNRDLGFFTGGYYWLVGLIPILIVAPDFMAHKIEFGVVTQSATAFSTLVGSFSLVVTQAQSISNFAAVVMRLESLYGAIKPKPKQPEAEAGQEQTQVTYQGLSLSSPQTGEILLKELSLTIPAGTRVLVRGAKEAAGVALFRVTAGLAVGSEGQILRPDADKILFLPERPYLPPGKLREILVPASQEDDITDDSLLELLGELDLDAVLEQVGGLDGERDWNSLLSLAEQQRLAFIHVLLRKPYFVFLDRAETALSPEQISKLLAMLAERAIGYVSTGQDSGALDCFDAILEIDEDGGWRWQELEARP